MGWGVPGRKRVEEKSRALKKVLLTKDSQINTNEGCSRFFDILHFFRFAAVQEYSCLYVQTTELS